MLGQKVKFFVVMQIDFNLLNSSESFEIILKAEVCLCLTDAEGL